MSYDDKIEEVIKEARENFDLLVKKYEEKLLEKLKEFSTKLEADSKEISNSAEKSLKSAKSQFISISSGIIALVIFGFMIYLYSEYKDVNKEIISLQKDIITARTTIENEKKAFVSEIENAKKQISQIETENARALSVLHKTENQINMKINEIEKAISKIPKQP